MKHRKSLCR